MAKPSTPTRNLQVLCPFCADADATLSLDLNDLNAITCSACDEVFSAQAAYERAAELAARWASVVEWIGRAPTV